MKNKKTVKDIISDNLIISVALIVALVSVAFVPIDSKYISYYDTKTLISLICVLTLVSAFKNINIFYIIAKKIVYYFKDIKYCILAIVCITFIGSMVIANDMALITFLPLGYIILKTTKKEKYMAFTFIMQNIAANLGGMLTPFGNPQNLFLYNKFKIPNLIFIKIMAPPFIISIILIIIFCLIFVKKESIKLKYKKDKTNILKATIYSILFISTILIIFRIIPYRYGLIIPVIVLLIDYKAVKNTDYSLIVIFFLFFTFAGNIARVDFIKTFLSILLTKNTLLFSTMLCQFISNVPTAILLSNFTTNYKDLLVGVNIGGVGTLIASLASLITFREYIKHNPKKKLSYLIKFSLFNFLFLFILILFMNIIK